MRTTVLATVVVVALGQFAGCRKETHDRSAPSIHERAEAGPATVQQPNEFTAKLNAAMAINDTALRNSTLAAVAVDAAASAQDEVVKSAIAEIRDSAVKNQTAATAALKLAECKKLAQATEVAKMINDTALKNSVLSKLAKGESGG